MLRFFRFFLDYYKKNRKQILILFFSFILGAILFTSIFFYVDYKDLAQQIFKFSFWKFLIFLIVSSLVLILTTYRWSLVLKAYDVKIKFWKLFRYRLAGFGFSYMTPIAELGGAPFRAYLLKKENVKFSTGLLTVIIDNFLDVFTQSLIAAFGLALFISHLGLSSKMSWLLGVSAAFFIILVAWVYLRLRRGRVVIAPLFKLLKIKKLYRKMVKIERPFVNFFASHRRVFFKAISLSLLTFLVSVFEIGILLSLMGFYLGIFNTFFAKVILNAANLFPVPAALGVSEWTQAGFFEGIMQGRSAGLTFSVLFKAKNIFYSLLGISFFLYWWHKRTKWYQKPLNFLKNKINEIILSENIKKP